MNRINQILAVAGLSLGISSAAWASGVTAFSNSNVAELNSNASKTTVVTASIEEIGINAGERLCAKCGSVNVFCK